MRKGLIAAGVVVGVAAIGLLAVKSTVAAVYMIPTTSMEPELPENSRVLVSKLSSKLSQVDVGDIVIYDTGAGHHVGRVDLVDDVNRRIEVSRNGAWGIPVDVEDVIGKVVLSTR